jgi:hypothetical protein
LRLAVHPTSSYESNNRHKGLSARWMESSLSIRLAD